ncbi:MAG: hypothetical protein ACKO1E_09975, partial [Acidimicrobiaceae bacterium]
MSEKSMKVLTLVGTRPELIKLSRVIPLLDKYTNHTFVHTGQNYSEQLFDFWGVIQDLDPPPTRC